MPEPPPKATLDDLPNRLEAFGFKASDQVHMQISDTEYQVTARLNKTSPHLSAIDYGKDIAVHHKGICDFSKPENFVVLECVLRLLLKGYPAKCIELEKNWKLGHRGKGRLDVFVRQKKRPFAMIECKTWGEEYLKARDRILEDGGQLFSYLIQEKATKTIVLYSSKVETGKVTVQAEAVNVATLCIRA